MAEDEIRNCYSKIIIVHDSVRLNESKVKILTLILIVLSFLDWLSTAYFVTLYGNGIEMNPIAKAVLDNWGITGLFAFKFVMVSGFLCLVKKILTWSRKTSIFLLWYANLVTGLVILYGLVS